MEAILFPARTVSLGGPAARPAAALLGLSLSAVLLAPAATVPNPIDDTAGIAPLSPPTATDTALPLLAVLTVVMLTAASFGFVTVQALMRARAAATHGQLAATWAKQQLAAAIDSATRERKVWRTHNATNKAPATGADAPMTTSPRRALAAMSPAAGASPQWSSPALRRHPQVAVDSDATENCGAVGNVTVLASKGSPAAALRRV